MMCKSSILPLCIILFVVVVYMCDGSTKAKKEYNNHVSVITNKAYKNLNIDENNAYWNKKTIQIFPIRYSILLLAENIKGELKRKSLPKTIEYKEITHIESAFMTKFFRVLHLKENRNNTKEPGSYGELGPYQIRRAFWIDGCEQLGVDINSPEWCYDINVWIDVKCRAVIKAYFEKYKVPLTIDDMCGAFNSGNRWTKKWHLTKNYRKEFKKIWFEEYGEKIE